MVGTPRCGVRGQRRKRSGLSLPPENIAFNTSAEATCAESVYEIQLTYEKTYHSYFRSFSHGCDVSQLLRVKERNDDDDDEYS